ncbi:class I SAM-dependent methyltransferase [Paraburkholderia sp. MMS20-SJTR3]|uniref:Class I SAM-dependent methyltransferase n=1 Tax=Paraburkholderia sejongensis TaxID=2886946 RepID=A0ABS8JTQ3_9BURK|nr:class I SAM-dependent methyltransferase [Paraburkholderia sp. MMS20-SJTR3]MCC8393252.1 class I SAM-dependent methyltransferase [Paraburkholderia sp. MMS20-SJTR3]
MPQVIENIDDRSYSKVIPCKVCGESSSLFGVVDFSKSCEDHKGRSLPLAGVPVYYHRCDCCGLVFTVALDKWSKHDYMENIYNDDYVCVDPDYVSVRPEENSEVTKRFCRENRSLKILDYGGGNGHCSRRLEAQGFDAKSWDPMDFNAEKPIGLRVDLVTAFEVMEHTPTPIETLAEASSFLKDDGVMFFSTLAIDQVPNSSVSVQHWYVAPRNGHITIFTQKSLDILAKKCGLQIFHANLSHHIAYRSVPAWLR